MSHAAENQRSVDGQAGEHLPRQPIESDVEVERAADGVTLTVPPAGIWRGSKGLFLFGVIWCAFFGFMTALVAVGLVQGEHGLIATLIFLGVFFWPIGIGMLLGAINMGRRRAVLAVVGDQLMVLQTGIFGSKRREWRRDEIAKIGIGPSGMQVNDVDIIELQIQPRSGKKFGMLAGRDESELRWLVAVLRQALGK